MPIVYVHLLGGRTPEEVQELTTALTDAVVRTTGSAPERVHVLVSEYEVGQWVQGGVPITRAQGELL